MGIASHILSLFSGTYIGIYLSQNYEIPILPSPAEIQKCINDYLDNHKKK